MQLACDLGVSAPLVVWKKKRNATYFKKRKGRCAAEKDETLDAA